MALEYSSLDLVNLSMTDLVVLSLYHYKGMPPLQATAVKQKCSQNGFHSSSAASKVGVSNFGSLTLVGSAVGARVAVSLRVNSVHNQ